MAENQLKKNNSRQDQLEMLRAMQKKLIMRAVLIVAVVLLTGVSFFALTAAWYTNIVGTDGLEFSAKQWNFTGKVEIAGEAVNAAPGDSGIIPITISNQGTEMAVASITTSKAGFDKDDDRMRKRIYFYVDAPTYRNGERLERVYVSAYSSYTYTLFPQSDLVLTEQQQDSHPLHWQWVYDVVGYYVMGREVNGLVKVEEYMRPIEYDFDIFTTTFDAAGNLLTVDGSKTVAELLAEVSATDGYAGDIVPSQKTTGGYYPVSVKDGYGVWAYLCTYEEIMEHSEFDTQVGTGEIQLQCPVEVTVTGSNSNGGAVEVPNAETLAAILTTSTHASVKLTGDIQLQETIAVAEGSRIEIDLNGKTLKSTQNVAFNVPEGAKLTINGGTDLNNPGVIQGNGAKDSTGVYATGAQVELNNVRITGVQEGVQVRDNINDNTTDSVVRIVDCYIEGSDDALWIFGNEGSDETATTVIVERSKLYGRGYIGVNCNGSMPNMNITIKDSEILGYYAGIYHPQTESTLTLQNCTIIGTADAGVVVKGGVVNIEDCRIFAQGQYAERLVAASGFEESGAGVYIEANYKWNVTVNISGNTTVSSANGEAIRLVKVESYDYNANFVITGGKFTSAVTANNSTEVDAIIIDGTIPEEFLADGYTTQEMDDGNEKTTVYSVVKAPEET